jgi:hypothetical protein
LVIELIGVIMLSTRPTTTAATKVSVTERSRAISAADTVKITWKVSVVGSSVTRSASSSPLIPARMPEENQATASTRRTGTPSEAVISRSSASARIAVPILVKRRNTVAPTARARPKPKAITCVQLTVTEPTLKPELSVEKLIERAAALPVQSHVISPSRISAKPSVATALTSGSRAASAGPKTTPYSRVEKPPTNTATT